MVKSPYPCVLNQIPNVPYHQFILTAIDKHDPLQVGMVDGVTGEEMTFGQIARSVRQVASGLCRLGVRQGDVFAMFGPNALEWPLVFYGAMATGATLTTINPAYTKYELQRHFEDSDPKWLFTTLDRINITSKVVKNFPNFKETIVLGEAEGCVPLSRLVADDGSLYPSHIRFDPRADVANIVYSSGTSGLPKGVMHTHYNLVANSVQHRRPEILHPCLSEPGRQAVALCLMPMYHVYGLVCILAWGLIGGYKLVVLARYEPETLLECIQKYKIHIASLVPPVVISLEKTRILHKYDISSLQIVLSGAAPLSREAELEFIRKYKVECIRQGYGLTETTSITNLHPNAEKKFASVGPPIASTEMIIVDADSKLELGPDEMGEIWIRGPQIMKGYLNNPEATKQAVDENGFFRSGDIGYYDQDGWFFVVDRLKELIKYRGFQVAPAELEALLLTHPTVSDAAVIGVPNYESGELPRAYVVLKPGAQTLEKHIKDFIKERVAYYKKLRGGVQIVKEIPKSPSGKILRRYLRDSLKHMESKL